MSVPNVACPYRGQGEACVTGEREGKSMEEITFEQVKQELMKLATGENLSDRAERVEALKVLADIILRNAEFRGESPH